MNIVAKNATWIILCRVIQAILALIINMMTARYLGPSNFGLITYAASLVTFAIPIMQLGFSGTLVQEIINHPECEGKVLGTSLLLCLCSSFLCIIGVSLFACITSFDEHTTIIVCFFYSIILFFQALDMMQYWFQAKLLSKYTSIASLFAYVVVSSYKLYLLFFKKSIYWFAVSNAFDYALISITIFLIYHKLGGQKLSFSLELGRKMFARSKHYIISGMMVTIFAQTDKVMLKMMIGEEATGYYGAALTCAGMSSFVFTAIIDSFRPAVFKGLTINREIFTYRLTLLYSIIIYLSLAQSICMTLFAKPIVLILYGKDYFPAIVLLQIVVWFTTFAYIGAIRNIWILAHDKQKYLWKINLFGAIANIVLNLLLIPSFGVYGAGIASIITQCFTNIIMGYIIKPISPNNAIMIKGLNPRYCFYTLKQYLHEH